ncbi:hypothetical protein BO79DRAFT_101249, partial [Aspergillus costaricaensis CBS 115574]
PTDLLPTLLKMSITIHSKVVELECLIPRVVDCEREDEGIQQFIPWVFQQSNLMDWDCTQSWPEEELLFKTLFAQLVDYIEEQGHKNMISEILCKETGITNILKPSETITLPRKSWRVGDRSNHVQFLHSQSHVLGDLMRSIYRRLEDLDDEAPRLGALPFPRDVKYVVGRLQYAARLEGNVHVGTRDEFIPIVSFTGWYKGQTWNELLTDTICSMLGHLTMNLTHGSHGGVQSQEVFVVGLHGPYLHICRGFFPRDRIARVYQHGYSDEEEFELEFTRGYNLYLKEDWLEATRALTRLL